MGQTNDHANQIRTDWIPAREAADENRTGSQYAESSVLFHCYTTGWLVCSDGPEKGRDYRLRSGLNRIGRRYDLEVCLFEDQGISRDGHGGVVYEEKSNTFYLVPGEGTATYVIAPDESLSADSEEGAMPDSRTSAGPKEALLTEPAILESGDRFRIGETTLEFIAYCREGVTW